MSNRGEQEKTRRTLLKTEAKSLQSIEMIAKFHDNMRRKRKRIEVLFEQSVPNQLYVFPRNAHAFSDSDDSDSDNVEQQYDLKAQNRKDKNYQTASSLHARSASLTHPHHDPLPTQPDSHPRDGSRRKEQPIQSQRQRKGEESNYNSRGKKEKKDDKTALNSSKKLIVAEQYSLGSNQVHTKKGSQTIIISYRSKKGEPPRQRLRTELP